MGQFRDLYACFIQEHFHNYLLPSLYQHFISFFLIKSYLLLDALCRILFQFVVFLIILYLYRVKMTIDIDYAAVKVTPFRRGTFNVTSPELVVRLRW